jgi:hypothetical protein
LRHNSSVYDTNVILNQEFPVPATSPVFAWLTDALRFGRKVGNTP